jgi:hypothetical protein
MTSAELFTFITALTLAIGPQLIGSWLRRRADSKGLQKTDVDASASAASALKSYSDEVIRLRGELAEMRQQMGIDRAERDKLVETIEEWQHGIQRLIGQLVSLGQVPVWQPKKVLKNEN